MCKYYLAPIFFCFGIAILFSQESSEFCIGKVFEIESNILGEKRTFAINLPASYENDPFYIQKSYPVLVVLDGQFYFHLVSGIVQKLSAPSVEKIPEMIVVGVYQIDRNQDFLPRPSDQQDENGTENSEQTTDSAQKFKQFLEQELLPELKRRYRTIDYKIIMGHSYGGLFVTNCFLEESIFDAHLAIDPSLWWDDAAINKKAKEILAQKNTFSKGIYVSQSNNPFNEGLTATKLGKAIQGFKGILDQTDINELQYHFDFFEQEDHFTVPLISLIQGLPLLFEGYRFPLNQIKKHNGSAIRQHYSEMANRFGKALLPPGKLLHQIGLFLIRDETQIQKGIDLFELVKEHYPNAYIPYFSLGEIYKQIGNKSLALQNYRKTLEILPSHEEAKERIAELEKD